MQNLQRPILNDLLSHHPSDKMLFLAGPRQVGKTSLAKQALAENDGGGRYFNWDQASDRRLILSHGKKGDLMSEFRTPGKPPLLNFDEIHKMSKFKGWLKGFSDEVKDQAQIWVTGSGRLDLYQKGGDSLLERYLLYHMHPITIGELQLGTGVTSEQDPDELWSLFENATCKDEPIEALLKFGGFPEPFLQQRSAFLNRWQASRRSAVTHEDIRDLTRIDDLDRLEYLVELLNPRIAAPLAINSLKEDLEVAHETVQNWLSALQRVYYVYALNPFSHKLQRALKKEQKYYFWDWSEVSDPASKFENFVISHFRKACHRWNDFGLGGFELWYLRDKEKNEVDVLLTRGKTPWLLAEITRSQTDISPSLIKFGKRLGCSRLVQLVATPGIHKKSKEDSHLVHVVSTGKFFQFLT